LMITMVFYEQMVLVMREKVSSFSLLS